MLEISKNAVLYYGYPMGMLWLSYGKKLTPVRT